MEYEKEIVDLVTNTTVQKISRDKGLTDLIVRQTFWLSEIGVPTEPQMRHRIFMILNEIGPEEYPRCSCGCGLPVMLNKTDATKGFRDFHSVEHSRRSKSVPKEAKEKLEDKAWFYEQRVVQRKSLNQIADELGISTSPVSVWERAHGLQGEVDSKRKSEATNSILDNKMEMERLYLTQRMTCRDIAELIGSSSATVSLKLREHGIEARESNDYDSHTHTTKPQIEIAEFVESLGFEVQLNNRTILGGKELDIVVHSHRFAIEYHGLFSHIYRPHERTESLIKGRDYHIKKTQGAEEKGYSLLQVFSDEWREKKDIIKSLIAQKLGVQSRRIFARKCRIVEVQKYDKKTFLNDNHIQGADRSGIAFGLMHENELLAVMTFCKSRFNSSVKWELSRFAVKQGNSVVGGFSKLLKHFRDRYEGSIVSYADRRYSQGNVYSKNGFRLERTNQPGYFYVNTSKDIRFHRMNFLKSKISQGPSDKRTEFEIASDMGFHKVFDCGTLCFILD